MGRGISQLDMRAREGVALLGTGFLKLDGMFICLFKLSSRWSSLQYDSSIFYLNWHSCSFWCSHLHLDPLWLLVLNIETDKCFAFTCIKITFFLSKESACLRQSDQNHNSNRQACGVFMVIKIPFATILTAQWRYCSPCQRRCGKARQSSPQEDDTIAPHCVGSLLVPFFFSLQLPNLQLFCRFYGSSSSLKPKATITMFECAVKAIIRFPSLTFYTLWLRV